MVDPFCRSSDPGGPANLPMEGLTGCDCALPMMQWFLLCSVSQTHHPSVIGERSVGSPFVRYVPHFRVLPTSYGQCSTPKSESYSDLALSATKIKYLDTMVQQWCSSGPSDKPPTDLCTTYYAPSS